MPDSLGRRVKDARLSLGLTQQELGTPDLSKSFISLLERDLTRPSVATLERLARRLQRPLSYFLASEDTSTVLQKLLDVLAERGKIELGRKRYDAALAVFAELCELTPRHGDATLERHAILGRGEALLGLRRLDDARRNLEEALTRARKAADAHAESRALHGLATVAQRNSHFTQAITLYDEALAVVAALPDPKPELHGEIVFYRGTALLRTGRLAEASEAYSLALEIFEHFGFHERVGEVLVSHGLALYLGGDYDGALLRLEGARVLLEKYEDLRTLSWARNNIGMVLLETGRPREALEQFMVSLAIKQRLQDPVLECHTLTELARCHFVCGEAKRAHEYAGRAIGLSHRGYAPDEEPRARIVLAGVAIAEGNTREAQRQLKQAAEHCEQASMTLELVTIFRELARAAAMLNRHKDASTYNEKAFAVLRTMAPHDAAAAIRMAEVAAQAHRGRAVTHLRSPRT